MAQRLLFDPGAVGVPVRRLATEETTEGHAMTNEIKKLIEKAERYVEARVAIGDYRTPQELVEELVAALRRAEAERDAALKQSARWEIQAQDMRDRLIKAEAERDAHHDLVLRLTAERDKAREALAQKHLSERQAVRYVLDRRNARIAELTATRDLLTAENARLQKEVATLELLRRGGK